MPLHESLSEKWLSLAATIPVFCWNRHTHPMFGLLPAPHPLLPTLPNARCTLLLLCSHTLHSSLVFSG